MGRISFQPITALLLAGLLCFSAACSSPPPEPTPDGEHTAVFAPTISEPPSDPLSGSAHEGEDSVYTVRPDADPSDLSSGAVWEPAAPYRPEAHPENPYYVAPDAQWTYVHPETGIRHTLSVENGGTYVDGVLIVNKTYPYPAGHAKSALANQAANALWSMRQAAKADGLSLWARSGFRSYWDQRTIHNRYVTQLGQAAADRISARPGYSEHHTGLAYDLNSLDFSFGDTAEGRWLASHCAEYGFIIRYPKGKEEITGYSYEPWHVRYVGVELAQTLYLGDGQFTTLEEYFSLPSSYSD